MKFERLGSLAKNLDNRRIPLNSLERDKKSGKGLYPYIGANNVMGFIDEYIFDEQILCIAEDGGSWGAGQICANIYNQKCWVNNHAHVLGDNGKAILNYLKYYLNYANLNKYISGTTRGKLTKTELESILVPSISISDQIHIANILSRAENLIAERKESIRLLDEFLKSTFLEMFGDAEQNIHGFPIKELETLCSTIVDCPHSTPIKSKSRTNYPCIRTSELTNGYISWYTMQYLDESEYIIRTQRLIPEEGDIVYGREGTYGEAIRIPQNFKFSLGQRTMLFRPDYTKTNSVYLWAMVRSNFVYRQAKKKNNGSTVGHVNIKDIRKFRILTPPLALQNKFAQIVENTEALKSQYQSSLLELKNLYSSLSQRAFRSELTAKDNVVLMAAENEVSYKAE